MRIFSVKCILSFFCSLPLLYSCTSFAGPSGQQAPLRIAVAANFAPVLEKILVGFSRQYKIEVQVISAASGTLYQQIRHGAPFDVFLSADSVRPQKLIQEKLALPDSLHTYAFGQLALWSAQHQTLTFDNLQGFTGKFAIANPRTAPYGKAAKQALLHLSLWEKINPQLVIGINVNQTFQQIRSQAVPYGIVAYSQLKLKDLQGRLIPQHFHQPIAQQLVILKSTRNADYAQQLVSYLLSDDTQKKISQFGYLAQLPIAASE